MRKTWIACVLIGGMALVACQQKSKHQSQDSKYFQWNKPAVVPCSKEDKRRKVFTIPKLGKMCLEHTVNDVIKTGLRQGRLWEPHLHRYFRRYIRKGSTALDIGAHIGSHTLVMAKLVGPKGQVHAWEPQLKIYQELLVNLDLNKATQAYAHFAALGDTHLRIAMSPPGKGNEGGTAMGSGGNRVELLPLDFYKLKNVSFIKIDVEGAEFSVLKGAAQTIKANNPVILFEAWAKNKKQRQAAARIFQFLGTLGYKHIARVSTFNYLAYPLGKKPY